MVETGIGSGSMYNVVELFTEQEVLEKFKEAYQVD